METWILMVAGCVLPLAAAAALAVAGFRNGDWTGEALARALRADLEAGGAPGEERVPPG